MVLVVLMICSFVSSDLGNHPLGHDFQHFFGLLNRCCFTSPISHVHASVMHLGSLPLLVEICCTSALCGWSSERLEVFAYNLRPEPDRTRWRSAITAAVEHWVDVGGISDEAAAATIARAGIDILINLNGYTPGARSRIFALRPSPIQVSQ